MANWPRVCATCSWMTMILLIARQISQHSRGGSSGHYTQLSLCSRRIWVHMGVSDESWRAVRPHIRTLWQNTVCVGKVQVNYSVEISLSAGVVHCCWSSFLVLHWHFAIVLPRSWAQMGDHNNSMRTNIYCAEFVSPCRSFHLYSYSAWSVCSRFTLFMKTSAQLY